MLPKISRHSAHYVPAPPPTPEQIKRNLLERARTARERASAMLAEADRLTAEAASI
jgi:hypothetical protein